MPLNQDCLGRDYGPSTTHVTDHMIAEFLSATLDDGRAYQQVPRSAPPTLAFVPCWPVIEAAVADPDLGAAPGQIIHGEQIMKFNRAIVAGDVLTTRGRIADISPKGRNELYVIHLETTDASGSIVVEQDNICISLGSAMPPGEPARAPESQEQPKRPAPAEPGEPDATATVQIPMDITRRYAAASADHNALHLDDAEARRLGFPGIIVHGMCLLSIALRDVVTEDAHADPNRVAELAVRFARPVVPGDTLSTMYWRDGTTCEFASFTADGTKALTNGRVVIRS
jgi:acyl dehydratase